MNQNRQSSTGFLLFVGIFLSFYVVLERIAVPSVKQMGMLAHYGLPLVWSIIITFLLWISLERGHILPKSMSLRLWARQEWSPSRVYGILISLFVLSAGLAAYFYIRSSREFLFPFVIASFSAVPLLFYWLYRMKLLYLVAGILSLLLGAFQLGLVALGRTKLHDEPAPTVLLGLLVTYALFFCYTGYVLIRRWRHPTGSWLGSWRSFVWGYLLVMSLSFVGLGIMSILQLKAAFVTVIPIGIYLFFYSLGKFISSVGTRNNPALIESYTAAVTLKNFLRFSVADRSQWEDSRKQVTDQGVTLTSLTRSLFDVLAFVAVIAAFAVFHEASTIQQISFALLVITFHIAANLSEYSEAARDTVAKARAHLEQELKVAHDMQMGLMPASDPVLPGFDISGLCKPANEVGGDYFDYVWLDEGKTKLGIAVADVSGKAMKAAITAVMTSGMVHREVGSNESPKTILRNINRPMYLKTDRRVFTAMCFAVLDIVNKRLSLSNAGQTYPLLFRNGTVEHLRVEGERLPLGIKEDVAYQEREIALQTGDVVMLYTDGVTESKNAKEELFGEDKVEEMIKKVDAEQPSKEIIAGMFKYLQQYAGSAPQHDDMTVVVVRVF